MGGAASRGLLSHSYSREAEVLYIGIIGTILGFYGDNGKENGNYYIGVIYNNIIVFGL